MYKDEDVFPKGRHFSDNLSYRRPKNSTFIGTASSSGRKPDYNYNHNVDRRVQISRFKSYDPVITASHVQWHFDIVRKGEKGKERAVARYESKVAEYRATILKIKPHAVSDSPSHRPQITLFPSSRYKTTETRDSSERRIYQLRPSSSSVYVRWKFVRTVLKIQRSRSAAMANGWLRMENAKARSLVRASKGRV